MFVVLIKMIIAFSQAGYEINALRVARMVLVMVTLTFFLCIVPAWCIVSIGCYLCGVATSLKIVLAVAGLIDGFYEIGALANKDVVKID
jgi:hypothetical protein